MNSNKNKILGIIFSFALLLVFNSCNDAPTDIGNHFLQDTITFYSILNANEVITDVKSYYYNDIHDRNTGALLVGKTSEYQSIGMIRFSVPTGKDSIKAEDILDCNINFKFNNYFIGDTNNFSFSIKEVGKSWDVETNIDDVLSGNLFKNNDIVNWNGVINPNDTAFNISLPFSKEVIVDWFKKIKDGINITDTIWGISIMPNAECNAIASFKSLDNPTNTSGTYIDIKYNIQTDTGTKIDSMIIYSAEEVHFVKDYSVVDSNSITLQGAAKIHSKMTLNFKSIPKLATITNAEMILSIDTNLNKNIPDTIFINYFDNQKESIINSIVTCVGLYDKERQSYVFYNGVANVINYFIRSKDGNGEFVLTYRNNEKENNKIERLNFLFDPNDKNKYIKLTIFYSKI